MKRSFKKVVSMGLILTTAASLAACGNNGKANNDPSKSEEIKKPEKIKVMCDGTVVTEPNGAKAFYDQLKQATGIDVEWIRPDHSGYYDAVSNAFNDTQSVPDVVLLSSDYYALYAANGLLWDMTETWDKSELKKNLVPAAQKTSEAYLVKGADGKTGRFGLSPVTDGGGCCTYIKETWLTQAGYKRADVENKTLTFDEYYAILKKMHEVTGKTVISAAGYISKEVPYTNYLPEFYQNAKFSFYKDASGKYVDGFSEKAMKEALARISKGVQDGIIDKESINNSTSDVRNKFYADNTGVFTYWAGTWAETLRANLETKGLNDSLIAIKPIKELGAYIMRIAPVFGITSNAQNPEGIFEYWLSKMGDGGDVQTLWTYGAKGVHWDDKAESVTVQGKEDSPVTYKEGEFHFIASPEKPMELMKKNHISPGTGIVTLKNGDPAYAASSKLERDNKDFFTENSIPDEVIPLTEEYGDYIADINKQRSLAVADVATGAKTAEEAVKIYEDKVGNLVKMVLESLNK